MQANRKQPFLVSIGILVLLSMSFGMLVLIQSPDNTATGAVISSSTSITSTKTTETLSTMTTNKVYDTTTDTCFQGQGSGINNTIRYVFKPSGFMYWQNKAGGNITVMGFSVNGLSTSTINPKQNSTTLNYGISNPSVTVNIFLKNIPSGCGNLPGTTFKILISGTATSPATLTMNFGNPNLFKATCDNTNHIITYGLTGINFTDSIAFGATCTNTALSFNIPAGAFKIDPVTISTSTSSQAISEFDNFFDTGSALWWAFYNDGSPKLVCRTSPDGTTWSAATTITTNIDTAAGNSGTSFGIKYATSTATVYYVSYKGASSIAAGTLYYRYGTLSASGCGSISWTISESSFAPLSNNIGQPRITVDSSNDIWVTIFHSNTLEVWRCLIPTACVWVQSLSVGSVQHYFGGLVALTSTRLGLVYQAGCASSTRFNVKFYTGTTWTTNTCSANNVGFITVNAIGDTLEMGSVLSASPFTLYYDSSPYTSGTPVITETSLGIDLSNSNCNVGMASDNSANLILEYSNDCSTTVKYITSSNSGSTWSAQTTLTSAETNISSGTQADQSVNISFDIISSNAGAEWVTGSGSPFNIRFAIISIIINAPVILVLVVNPSPSPEGGAIYKGATTISSTTTLTIGTTSSTFSLTAQEFAGYIYANPLWSGATTYVQDTINPAQTLAITSFTTTTQSSTLTANFVAPPTSTQSNQGTFAALTIAGIIICFMLIAVVLAKRR